MTKRVVLLLCATVGIAGTVAGLTTAAGASAAASAQHDTYRVPATGFVGTDTFTYSTTPAVHLYRTDLPPLATIGGIAITAGAYGSALAPVPGLSGTTAGRSSSATTATSASTAWRTTPRRSTCTRRSCPTANRTMVSTSRSIPGTSRLPRRRRP